MKNQVIIKSTRRRKNMRLRRIAFLVLLVSIVMLTAGCGGSAEDTTTNAPAADNNNTTNDNGEADTPSDAGLEAMIISGDLVLDPAFVTPDDIASQIICGYIYDSLVSLDSEGSAGPGLALTFDVSDQGLEYEFTLRTDAVFSDGTQVTADVILDNFNRWFDPEHPLHGADSSAYVAWLEYFKGFRGELDADGKPISTFDGIEKVDDLTVLVHLNEPMDDFLEVIARPFFSILNPDLLAAGGYGSMESSIDGTGAYMVGVWTAEGMTLVPNDGFWGDVPTGALDFVFE
jgi:peptide/nickel transport system substrate-binding protein